MFIVFFYFLFYTFDVFSLFLNYFKFSRLTKQKEKQRDGKGARDGRRPETENPILSTPGHFSLLRNLNTIE